MNGQKASIIRHSKTICLEQSTVRTLTRTTSYPRIFRCRCLMASFPRRCLALAAKRLGPSIQTAILSVNAEICLLTVPNTSILKYTLITFYILPQHDWQVRHSHLHLVLSPHLKKTTWTVIICLLL